MTTPSLTGLCAVAIVGPTASGKTGLGVELAKRLQTEIISADSMQFYRGMEIGAAAPTAEEQQAAPHHFVDFLNPDQPYSAGAFAKDASEVIHRLNQRDRLAIIVGGSGLYVSALVDGLFEGPARDQEIRQRLHREADELGVEALYARLTEVDAAYAGIVAPGDLRRIVRGLEVYEITGQPLSELHERHQREKTYLPALLVGIEYPREVLYDRINRRVDQMIEQGWVDEVRRLIELGYEQEIYRVKALGYREIAAYLRGEQTLEQAVEQTKMFIRRFAKRQLSWYRGDDRVRWIPAEQFPTAEMQADLVISWLG